MDIKTDNVICNLISFFLAANKLVKFDDSDDDFDSASQVSSSTQVRNSC